MSLTEDVFGVGVWGDLEFDGADIHLTTQCPEVWLLYAVDSLQLAHLANMEAMVGDNSVASNVILRMVTVS